MKKLLIVLVINLAFIKVKTEHPPELQRSKKVFIEFDKTEGHIN